MPDIFVSDCDERGPGIDYSFAGTLPTTLPPSPTPISGLDVVAGFDTVTGAPVTQITTVYRDNTVEVTYLNAAGAPIAAPSGFTGSIDTEKLTTFATMVDPAEANYGQVLELNKVTSFVGDEVIRVAYYDVDGTNVTATVTGAGWEIGADTPPLSLGMTAFSTTGTIGTPLPAFPTFATFARVTVDPDPVQVNGIKYRTDGAAPTAALGVVVPVGGAFSVNAASFADTRIVPVNGTGQVDGTVTVNMTVEWFNAEPEGV